LLFVSVPLRLWMFRTALSQVVRFAPAGRRRSGDRASVKICGRRGDKSGKKMPFEMVRLWSENDQTKVGFFIGLSSLFSSDFRLEIRPTIVVNQQRFSTLHFIGFREGRVKSLTYVVKSNRGRQVPGTSTRIIPSRPGGRSG
jgi:hypothetical protein